MATATLWERIVGLNLPATPPPEDEKIPIHGFWGMIHEWERGYETQSNILDFFNLEGDQLTDAQVIKQNINAAPDKTTFIRVCKDWSYSGEIVNDPLNADAGKYLDWDAFVTRMNNEVIDQGGIAP